MTREEILALPTGKKLDALVAEKVMGWEAKPGRAYYWTGKDRVVRSVFYQFSTDISAAWELLCKFKTHQVTFHENGFYQQSDMKYRVIIAKNQHVAYANTAPEAICKAALLAVMDKEAEA